MFNKNTDKILDGLQKPTYEIKTEIPKDDLCTPDPIAETVRVEKEPKKKCQLEKDGYCDAAACYTNVKCNARDGQGNPKYSDRLKDKQTTVEAKPAEPEGDPFISRMGILDEVKFDTSNMLDIEQKPPKQSAENLGEPIRKTDKTDCCDATGELIKYLNESVVASKIAIENVADALLEKYCIIPKDKYRLIQDCVKFAKHIHINNGIDDVCQKCNMDLRHIIHKRMDEV